MMLTPNELDLDGEYSNVLYITGLVCKGNSKEEIEHFLSTSRIPYNESTSEKQGGGKLWVRYHSIEDAKKAQALLHQQSFKGCTVMCRFELGFDPSTGKRLISRKSIHTTCIRQIQRRRGQSQRNNSNDDDGRSPTIANYSYKSLSIGEIEYPFPSGLYLARLIMLVQKWPNRLQDPLVELVSNNYVPPNLKKKTSVFGNRYAKEITESMAMVDAVERSFKLCLGRSPSSFRNDTNNSKDGCVCRVYCVGDGKYPVTAACMALNFPYLGWEFVSIDPLLEPLLKGHKDQFNHRLIEFSGISQDYEIPNPPRMSEDQDEAQYLDLVIACHSHAPLQEFWDRILDADRKNDPNHRAIAITMSCCANYSDLNQEPILTFQDYECYSPKREIKIYNDFFCSPILK